LYFFHVCVATAEEFILLKFSSHFLFCISIGKLLPRSALLKKEEFFELLVLYLRMSIQSTGVIFMFLPFGFLRCCVWVFRFLSPSSVGLGGSPCPKGKMASHPLGLVQNWVAASGLSSCLAGILWRIFAIPEKNFKIELYWYLNFLFVLFWIVSFLFYLFLVSNLFILPLVAFASVGLLDRDPLARSGWAEKRIGLGPLRWPARMKSPSSVVFARRWPAQASLLNAGLPSTEARLVGRDCNPSWISSLSPTLMIHLSEAPPPSVELCRSSVTGISFCNWTEFDDSCVYMSWYFFTVYTYVWACNGSVLSLKCKKYMHQPNL